MFRKVIKQLVLENPVANVRSFFLSLMLKTSSYCDVHLLVRIDEKYVRGNIRKRPKANRVDKKTPRFTLYECKKKLLSNRRFTMALYLRSFCTSENSQCQNDIRNTGVF